MGNTDMHPRLVVAEAIYDQPGTKLKEIMRLTKIDETFSEGDKALARDIRRSYINIQRAHVESYYKRPDLYQVIAEKCERCGEPNVEKTPNKAFCRKCEEIKIKESGYEPCKRCGYMTKTKVLGRPYCEICAEIAYRALEKEGIITKMN